jgi:Na+/H+ antiporter NhaD/arsenite permease-like protein
MLTLLSGNVVAAESEIQLSDFTGHWAGLLSLAVFVLAYLLVAGEEPLSLKKSKPMLVAAGLIWVLVAIAYTGHGDTHTAAALFRLNIERYIELFLFLLAAMTYVNAMSERGIFSHLRQWLIANKFTLRQIFWITGLLTFIISPFIANLAVALIMVTIVVAVAGDNRRFTVASSINIVVAANAGGVFSPFGDITTLMIWQRGLVDFGEFLLLLAPALCNWLIPALILSFTVSSVQPDVDEVEVKMRDGAWIVIGLFVITLIMAVSFESLLKLPAVIGMMTGLGLLKLYGYRLKRQSMSLAAQHTDPGEQTQYDIFHSLERSEWDTLMFLLGIIVSVGGLAAMGYLLVASEFLYGQLGPTAANVMVGVLSAFVENVPVMYSVLSMQPDMQQSQWLLVTLTAGVGGSLLSIGSAAGVAVMGQAQGIYTFMAHLRWTWAIALGYAASIWLHLFLNSGSL